MASIPIGAALRLLAEADPHRPAITDVGRDLTVTRLDLERRTNRLARAYLRLGVVEGSFVTIGLPNGVDFYEACLAAWKCGATPQPVSHRLPPRERDEIIALACPSLVVTDPIEPGERDDDGPLLPDRVAPAYKAPTSGGSTGRPKIIVSGAPATTDPERDPPFGGRRDGTQLVPGPLYHNAPFMFSMSGLFSGNHLVVMPRFDATGALSAIERYRVDWTLLVPTMMSRMLKVPGRERFDLSSLNGILHLAAPCPPWVKEAWCEWIGAEKVWELYAGTEAQGVTIVRGDEWLAHRGTVGRVAPGSMQIRDPETGAELPPGEIGELWMRPPAEPTYRYIGADARRDAGGWESLGDLGSIDEDGYLYLADRRTDLILSGGANVYPAEVEAALDEHPAVRSAAVIGLPDDDLGQRVHAVVEIEPGADVRDEDLRAFLATRLVSYKIPRSFERADGPVRDDAGKVRRPGLRDARLHQDHHQHTGATP